MAVDMDQGVRASRLRVPRSRGAISGIALIILGAWAAIVPFIGPYFDFAFAPAPNDAWHWTAGRGWLELLPGCAAVVAGILLLVGTHRVNLAFASWLGVASGAWLVVGPILAPRISLTAGAPASATPWVQTLEELFFFFAVGAAILFFSAMALGRLSVQSVRDVRAAQRRAEAEAAREAEERRIVEERLAAERERGDAERREHETAQVRTQGGADSQDEQWARQREQAAAAGRGDPASEATARHERPADQPPTVAPPASDTAGYPTNGATETREYPAQHNS
jgi:hypothetical protein